MKESGFYPPGAEFDSNAPYNQSEVEYIPCTDCDGTGFNDEGENGICLICEGSGEIPRTFEDDLADEETAAEEEGDRIRNESHFYRIFNR